MRQRLLHLALALAGTATLTAGATTVALVATAAPTPARVTAGAQVGPVQVAPPARVRLAPTKAATRPKPAATPHVVQVRRPAPQPVVRPRTTRTSPAPVPTRPRVTLSQQQLMLQAVARIPGYRPGITGWAISSKYGHWGEAVLGGDMVYISPDVPANMMYDVVAHEWSHMLSVADYGNMPTAVAGLNAFFGGTGLVGAERAADCMARELGATWTHYTSCTDSTWRAGARRLLAGQPA